MKKQSVTVLAKWIIYVCTMFVSLSCLLFLSGGSFSFWGAWFVIGAVIVPMLVLGIYLFCKNPELLAERMNHREQQREQQNIINTGGIVIAAGLVAAGIDFRFGILQGNQWVCMVGALLIFASYVIYYLTFRQNRSLFRTVKVSENQQLISTGIYGIIRHPMYLASSLFYAGLIAVLNSGIAAITILAMFPLLYRRVKHEEAFLSQNLPGYTEYMQKVQYRIIPYVW
jgi:protein-S-isoprenylcysteine O-methyltransferase Ste14